MSRYSTRAWRRLRAAILDRDGHVCQRPIPPAGHPCGRPATDAGHIIAAAYGGTDHPDNLRAECEPCNATDGGRIRTALQKARTP